MKRISIVFLTLLALFFYQSATLLALSFVQNETFSELNLEIALSTDTNDVPVENEMPQRSIIEEANDPVVAFAQEMPIYEEGESGMEAFLQKNIQYPDKSKEMDCQGTVYIRMIVEKDGTTSGHEIARDVICSKELGKEALRVCKLLKFKSPGKIAGKPIRVAITVPIKFSIKGSIDGRSNKHKCVYKNGEIALIQKIETEMEYPKTALASGITATYIVTQTINSKGKVTRNSVYFKSGTADEAFEKEALRIAKKIKKYECYGFEGFDCDTCELMYLEIKFDKYALEKAKKK